MIKKILNSFAIARKFETQINMVNKFYKKKDTHKLRLTKEQIEILELCAMLGIYTSKQLKAVVRKTLTNFR